VFSSARRRARPDAYGGGPRARICLCCVFRAAGLLWLGDKLCLQPAQPPVSSPRRSARPSAGWAATTPRKPPSRCPSGSSTPTARSPSAARSAPVRRPGAPRGAPRAHPAPHRADVVITELNHLAHPHESHTPAMSSARRVEAFRVGPDRIGPARGARPPAPARDDAPRRAPQAPQDPRQALPVVLPGLQPVRQRVLEGVQGEVGDSRRGEPRRAGRRCPSARTDPA
jgi:hypothetical protein